MTDLTADEQRKRYPLMAIRAKCVECSGGSTYEANRCHLVDCPLWLFRLGKRPDTAAKHRPELFDIEYVRKLAEADGQ